MSFRVAFAKGRGSAECIGLLEQSRHSIPKSFYDGKLPVHYLPDVDTLCVLVRGRDLARLLHDGHVDAAIGSSLLFEEYGGPDLVQLASLEIAACRFSLITLHDKRKEDVKRIATRYPNLTKRMFEMVQPAPAIIQFNGCVESALFLGLTDSITDVVETGWTLSALSLYECEILSFVSHSIWLKRSEREKCGNRLAALMPSIVVSPEVIADC